jgi:FkbM family methyltransferase
MASIKELIKQTIHASTGRFGYRVFDLRKDQGPNVFLPGHLQRVFSDLGINCVIDVGANFGQYASLIRSAGFRGRLVSIEPIPEVYEQLQRKAAFDQSWLTFNFALGERDQTKDFNVFGATDLSSFLPFSSQVKPNDKNRQIVETLRVQVKTLDSLFDKFTEGIAEPRVFLKLDTQGYDIEVIKGARACIGRTLGIQSEVAVIAKYSGMPDYLQALAFYRELGFEPTGLFPVGNEPETGHIIELDAVLTRLSGVPR